MLAWSRNTHQLLRVFTHITGLGSPIAETLFFSYASDAGQRKVLLDLAVALELGPVPTHELKKIFERLEKVAGARNVAAHTPFGLTLFDLGTGAWAPKVVPALGRHVDKRRQSDVVRQLREADAELSLIYDALEHWLLHTQYPERLWGKGKIFIGEVSALGVPQPAEQTSRTDVTEIRD
ncbi:hypothetical protein [Ancylobacter moscoviensis]